MFLFKLKQNNPVVHARDVTKTMAENQDGAGVKRTHGRMLGAKNLAVFKRHLLKSSCDSS